MSGDWYRFAQLAEHFKLRPVDIAVLTDAQIALIFFAQRDRKTGVIEKPPERPPRPPFKLGQEREPPTPAQSRRDEYNEGWTALTTAYQNGMIPLENYKSSVRAMQAKFADLWSNGTSKPDPDVAHLRSLLASGTLTQDQYDEAVSRLNE